MFLYKNVFCPECAKQTLLLRLHGELIGRIEIKCYRCKELFIITDDGIIAKADIKYNLMDYKGIMEKTY
jgi:phage FluMu protein Com